MSFEQISLQQLSDMGNVIGVKLTSQNVSKLSNYFKDHRVMCNINEVIEGEDLIYDITGFTIVVTICTLREDIFDPKLKCPFYLLDNSYNAVKELDLIIAPVMNNIIDSETNRRSLEEVRKDVKLKATIDDTTNMLVFTGCRNICKYNGNLAGGYVPRTGDVKDEVRVPKLFPFVELLMDMGISKEDIYIINK